jgi:flagellar protein FlbT
MPLRLDLKPNEKIFIGGAVLVNGDSRSAFTVLNDVAILREKDIMTDAEANTPCKRIYLAIQLMYMDPAGLDQYQKLFWSLAKEVVSAAPSTSLKIADIGEEILALRYYQALKLTLDLIKYEKELVAHVSEPT